MRVPLAATPGATVKARVPVVAMTEVEKVTVWEASLGPGVAAAKPAMVCAPASSLIVGGLAGVNAMVGGSFRELTVMVRMRGSLVLMPPLAVPPLSTTVTL